VSVAAPADTPDLRAALESSEFYPDQPDHVQVVETHVSWVFLAGDRAYKLKKPVVLPFLDYGTAQRRREMCREEVRLNRRLAGDIYLGTRAVVATEHGFRLTDDDDPLAVDYLVEMRRYDERSTLAAKLERGVLMDAEIAEVARALVEFHARARRCAPAGRPARTVLRRVAENCHQLLDVIEQGADIDRVLELERFAHAFVMAHARTLEARARGGLFREGHGDLRADHVLVDGSVRIVDCVEFDGRLRELDVADDLAFLVMDLAVRGGERCAQTLVRAYRAAGGEPGEDWLIAFYAADRALVRAKVALVRASQCPAASPERGRRHALARDLVGVAERCAWRARLPLAIVICGAPASGKSHLAHALAEVSGLPHLSSDVTRKRLAGLRPRQPAPAAAYSADFNRLTYAELGRRAAAEVARCGGVLIDATCRHRVDRAAFAASFGHAAPVLFIECRAPADVLARRAAERDRQPGQVSDASAPIVVREAAAWEDLDELDPETHLTVRSDRPVEAQLTDLRALLDRRIGRPGSWR